MGRDDGQSRLPLRMGCTHSQWIAKGRANTPPLRTFLWWLSSSAGKYPVERPVGHVATELDAGLAGVAGIPTVEELGSEIVNARSGRAALPRLRPSRRQARSRRGPLDARPVLLPTKLSHQRNVRRGGVFARPFAIHWE